MPLAEVVVTMDSLKIAVVVTVLVQAALEVAGRPAKVQLVLEVEAAQRMFAVSVKIPPLLQELVPAWAET